MTSAREAEREPHPSGDFEAPVYYLRREREIDGAARTEPAPEPAPPRVRPHVLAWMVAVAIFLAAPTAIIIALIAS